MNIRFFFLTLCAFSLLSTLAVPSARAAEQNGSQQRTWKTIAELSEVEKVRIDFRLDTPRDSATPYLPAERYPFEPPYTAEEMGYRSMEFPHVARWSHAMADVFGAITSNGMDIWMRVLQSGLAIMSPTRMGCSANSPWRQEQCIFGWRFFTPIHRRVRVYRISGY